MYSPQSVNWWADSVIAYVLAFYAMVAPHGSEIMGVLGFILLLAKLAQELPKAYRAMLGKTLKSD